MTLHLRYRVPALKYTSMGLKEMIERLPGSIVPYGCSRKIMTLAAHNGIVALKTHLHTTQTVGHVNVCKVPFESRFIPENAVFSQESRFVSRFTSKRAVLSRIEPF